MVVLHLSIVLADKITNNLAQIQHYPEDFSLFLLLPCCWVMQKTILHFSHNFLSCYPENITAPCEIFGRNKGAIASRLKELNDNNKVIVYGGYFRYK